MLGPLLRVLSSSRSEPDSWLARVRENLSQLFASTGFSPSPANGAPIHLLKAAPLGATRRAQTVSLLTHAAVLATIAVFAVNRGPSRLPSGPAIASPPGRLIFTLRTDIAVDKPSLGPSGSGGENNPAPATHGFLAPHSSVQLAQPRLPDNLNHQLPVPVTILDAQAPPVLTPVSELGLPWMPKDANSAGPGKDGIGSRGTGGMGDRDGRNAGQGESDSPYANGITMPTCKRCPLPVYTDEARHVKMQGTVTLRVLVGVDGKASDIRVVRGIGYGLDERAVDTVRGWDFTPARDAGRRAVASWVTIEAVFRLF